jgi:chromodomain-helicase-DNA-binding protein 7
VTRSKKKFEEVEEEEEEEENYEEEVEEEEKPKKNKTVGRPKSKRISNNMKKKNESDDYVYEPKKKTSTKRKKNNKTTTAKNKKKKVEKKEEEEVVDIDEEEEEVEEEKEEEEEKYEFDEVNDIDEEIINESQLEDTVSYAIDQIIAFRKIKNKRRLSLESQSQEIQSQDKITKENNEIKILNSNDIKIIEVNKDDENKNIIEEKKVEDQFEYLVKYKDKAYIHCEWIKESVLLEKDPGRYKRFHKKYRLEDFEEIEDGDFYNPEYEMIDRILDTSVNNGKKIYLVKWKALQYKDSTWEWERTILKSIDGKKKIKNFIAWNKYPENYNKAYNRPKNFEKMDVSPKFQNDNQLREYQLEGLNWLYYCWCMRRNSILADEMVNFI